MSVPKIKYDWYQTETHVVVTILVKNSKDVKVEYGERTVSSYLAMSFSFSLKTKFILDTYSSFIILYFPA